MSLAYNENCPTLYQPPYFVDIEDLKSDGNQTLYGELWEGPNESLGKVETVHHRVNIDFCSKRSVTCSVSTDLQDTAMSNQLRTMQKPSSIYSTILLSTIGDPGYSVAGFAIPMKPQNSFSKRRTPTPARVIKRGSSKRVDEEPISGDHIDLMGSSHNFNEPVDVDEEHQSSVKTTDLFSISPSKMAELLVQAYALQNQTGHEVFDAELLNKGIIRRWQRSIQVKCECGSDHPAHNMVGSVVSRLAVWLIAVVVLRTMRQLATSEMLRPL